MPLTLPSTAEKLTRTNFADIVKSFVDSLETALNRLTSRVGTVETNLSTKYAKPAGGIPATDLTGAAQAQLASGGAANVRWIEWLGNTALTRPNRDPNVQYRWVKRDPALPDPPTDDTHMLIDVDVLERAF